MRFKAFQGRRVGENQPGSWISEIMGWPDTGSNKMTEVTSHLKYGGWLPTPRALHVINLSSVKLHYVQNPPLYHFKFKLIKRENRKHNLLFIYKGVTKRSVTLYDQSMNPQIHNHVYPIGTNTNTVRRNTQRISMYNNNNKERINRYKVKQSSTNSFWNTIRNRHRTW